MRNLESFKRRGHHSGLLRYKLVKETVIYRQKGKYPSKVVWSLSTIQRGYGAFTGVLGRGESEGKKKSSGRERGARGRVTVNGSMQKGT